MLTFLILIFSPPLTERSLQQSEIQSSTTHLLLLSGRLVEPALLLAQVQTRLERCYCYARQMIQAACLEALQQLQIYVIKLILCQKSTHFIQAYNRLTHFLYYYECVIILET